MYFIFTLADARALVISKNTRIHKLIGYHDTMVTIDKPQPLHVVLADQTVICFNQREPLEMISLQECSKSDKLN